MNKKKWSNRQKNIFKLYFTNKNALTNGINISKVIDSTWEYHLKWEKFCEIIKKYSPEIDYDIKIDRVELINFNENSYLVLKIYSWTYLCINLSEEKIVDFEDDNFSFNEQFFIDNFDEEKVDSPEKLYFFIDFLDDGLDELLSFIKQNKNLFLTSTCFTYKIEENECLTFLDFSILNGNITLYFGNKYMTDNTDYICIDKDFEPISINNSNGNINKLKKMCTKIKNIKIPLDVIPNFLLENIRYNELLQ